MPSPNEQRVVGAGGSLRRDELLQSGEGALDLVDQVGRDRPERRSLGRENQFTVGPFEVGGARRRHEHRDALPDEGRQRDTPQRTPEWTQPLATALGADAKNWWFLNAGDAKATHTYLEQTLKFFGIRERSDPADIEANGRYAHDLGFILVDRDFNVIGKWPLADARSDEARQRDPELYDRVKQDLFNRIRAELNKKPSNP